MVSHRKKTITRSSTRPTLTQPHPYQSSSEARLARHSPESSSPSPPPAPTFRRSAHREPGQGPDPNSVFSPHQHHPQPLPPPPQSILSPSPLEPPLQSPSRKRKRKGFPVRSPSHKDLTRGVIFAFRIQSDPSLSMTIDILREPAYNPPVIDGSEQALISADTNTNHTATITTTTTTVPSHGPTWFDHRGSWPSSNYLVLHARQPADSLKSSGSWYDSHQGMDQTLPDTDRRPRLESTPSWSGSDSFSSLSSSSLSSLLSSPRSPSMSGEGGGEERRKEVEEQGPCSPLELVGSKAARCLNVRGLGARGRMQVVLVK